MKIILDNNENINGLSEYFVFNQIPHTKLELYDPSIDTYGRYTLSHSELSDRSTLLCITFNTLVQILKWEQSNFELRNFLCNNNQLWVWGDIDNLLELLDNTNEILSFDQWPHADAVTIFYDGGVGVDSSIGSIKNIRLRQLPFSWWQRLFPRIHNGTVTKTQCDKDYLITTILKSQRPHRQVLKSVLNKYPNIIDRGLVRFGNESTKDANWLGHTSPVGDWFDGYASMDLYLNAWLEVVPETLCQGGCYITEKTIKPMATKTPFLMVTTPGYLKFLRAQGFKTFESLIDERYDQIDNLNDRVEEVVTQLQDIINNGAKDFYQASAEILEHNQARALEIKGRWEYAMDQFISVNLEEARNESNC